MNASTQQGDHACPQRRRKMFRSKKWALMLVSIMFVLSACAPPMPAEVTRIVEVTKEVPVEVTRIVEVVKEVAVTATPAPAPPPPEGKPPEVVPLEMLPPETAEITAFIQAIEAETDAYSARMIEMNDWLYYNPESGHQEFKATEMFKAELEKHGFEVTLGVEGLEESYNAVIQERYAGGGLPTALVAKYKGKTEEPVIAFMYESDALRRAEGPFHGCQHNQQGPVAVGAAIALSKVMEANNLPGSVWVIHTPAEEIPPPNKVAMAKAGVFDDVDFLIRSHGTPQVAKTNKAGLGNCCMLIDAALYDFHGRPAHGAFNPWAANDALDAARLFFAAVDALREHSEPDFRFMGTITKVGAAPNVINDQVQVDHWIRNNDRAGQEALNKKIEQVDNAAKGAAMATGTTVDIRHYGKYTNGIESGWLNALASYYVHQYGDAAAISEELGNPSGWDEGGYAAVNVPGISIQPAVAGIPEAAGHTDENAAIAISPEGHKGLIQTANISAAVGLRLVVDPELRAKVTEEQRQWQEWGLEEKLITEDMIRE